MRTRIESFDNKDGTATKAIARAYDATGKLIGAYETRWYKTYPRSVRARDDAENFLKAFARKRLQTCTFDS